MKANAKGTLGGGTGDEQELSKIRKLEKILLMGNRGTIEEWCSRSTGGDLKEREIREGSRSEG